MTKLEIPVTGGSDANLQITINDEEIDFIITNNTITADVDFFGLSVLKIKLLNSSKIQFENVFIDGVGLRQFLFLSWAEEEGQKIQPCTELWKENLTWHIPISNPLSLLINIANEKFATNDLGSNLFEKYDIFYPESIEIDGNYSKLIKDFFKYNFDFYARKKVEKNNLYGDSKIPYFFFDYDYDKESLLNELKENHDYLIANEFLKPLQHGYNQTDSGSKFDPSLNWKTVYTYMPRTNNSLEDFTLDKNKLPNLYNFYKNLPLDNIFVSFIGILPPGGYIAPHVDHRPGILPQGCTQLYFALNPSDDHYFKINGVGLLPLLENCVSVINNQNYTHTVVNRSNEMRYALGMFANVDQSFFKNIR